MIPLVLGATSEAGAPFVTRLARKEPDVRDSLLIESDGMSSLFSGPLGLVEITGAAADELEGDVVLVNPQDRRAERLIRAGSDHNTLLVTERCDQLCVMCSQPPKKTHVDRFALLEQACLLAPQAAVIGITGGEPTLYKDQLLGLIERVLHERPDLAFHVLTNGQHFEAADIRRLRDPVFQRVTWGIPLYAADQATHDRIVAKAGAFERLQESFHHLLNAGAIIELRTVILQTNAQHLPALASHIVRQLRHIDTWSIMQLENIGFARNRWDLLYFDHAADFAPVAAAIDTVELHGLSARLFNFPRCSVPVRYRDLAEASISDWKKKFMPDCASCGEQDRCTGFFEWHPDNHRSAKVLPL